MQTIEEPQQEVRASRATIEDVQESKRLYIEPIAELQVEIKIDRLTKEERLNTTLTGYTKGKLYIQLPKHVDLFRTREENIQVYDTLGAIHAAAHKYAYHTQIGGVRYDMEEKELEDIITTLEREGQDMFGKEIPFNATKAKGATKGMTHPNLLHKYFGEDEEEQKFYEKIRRSVDNARVMTCFYYNNAGAPERHRQVLTKLFEQEITALQKIQEDIEQGQTITDKKGKITMRGVFQNIEFTTGTRKEESDMILERVMTKLKYTLITGIPQFEKPEEERQTIYPEKARGREQQTDAHLYRIIDIAKPIYVPGATEYTTLLIAGRIYYYFHKRKKSNTFKRLKAQSQVQQSINQNQRPPQEFSIADNIETATALSTASEAKSARATAERQSKEKRVLETLTGTHPYHEWCSIQRADKQGHILPRGYIPKYVHVKEEKEIPKAQEPIYEYPNIDKTITRRIMRQFEQLPPAGRTIIRRQHKGKLDTRAFTRYAEKVRAGIPTRADYYYKETEEERSVATLLLLDISDSTGTLITEQYSILDKLKE